MKRLVKLKRLSTLDDNLVSVFSPVSSKEASERIKQYDLLAPKKFATKYKDLLFNPVDFEWNVTTYKVQYNHCTNPFCKWYGMPQEKFTTKGRLSRYRLSGTDEEKSIICNPDPVSPTVGVTLNCNSKTVSNWSVAEEIARLVRVETVKDIEPEYEFHKEDCADADLNPFDNPKSFYRRGKSSSNSQKYQCKSCKKMTNVLPSKRECTTYHQQRNDILPMIAKHIVNKTPITRTCEILEIGRSTYYQKLEWLYRCCLEFLDKYEKKALENRSFKEIWLNTDKMNYNLNNVRKKGQGERFEDMEDTQFPTSIVVTSDVHSRYVFRSDVAYDWDITFGDIALDTILYKEDHLNEFARKNGRFGKFSAFPQPPSKNDTQTKSEYENDLKKFEIRERYVEGLHINATYTTIAHLWLIKQLVKATEWRFVTDKDNSLMSSIYRVFSKEIRLSDAHHFLCQTDKTKTRSQARKEFKQAAVYLLDWGNNSGYDTKSLKKLAYLKLEELFHTHHFHKVESDGFHTYNVHAGTPIEHPLASPDRGFRWVDCTTDLSSLEPGDIANFILNVNDNATNNFIQLMRRRLSVLERPIVTARGDGKSYIYSNYNPKYAQMALTILRVYYNFCKPYKTTGFKSEIGTPAQRLGLTDKVFTLKDVIYMR